MSSPATPGRTVLPGDDNYDHDDYDDCVDDYVDDNDHDDEDYHDDCDDDYVDDDDDEYDDDDDDNDDNLQCWEVASAMNGHHFVHQLT